MSKIMAILALVIFVIIVTVFTGYSLINMGNNNISSNITTDNGTIDLTCSPIVNNTSNNLVIPDNNVIISLINWSRYPIIGYHYISNSSIRGPNTVINHTFLKVTMNVEIKDSDNVLEVYKEMSSIVKAERAMLDPNSAPEIWGDVEGNPEFHVGMLPYSTEIYRIDYHHPVNNLTWNDIDASEVD